MRHFFFRVSIIAFVTITSSAKATWSEDDFCTVLKSLVTTANSGTAALAVNQGAENFSGPYRKNYKPDLHMFYDSKVVIPGSIQSVNSIWKGATTFQAIMAAEDAEYAAKGSHTTLQAKVEACLMADGATVKKYSNGSNNIFYEVKDVSVSVRYSSLGGNGKTLVYVEVANIASVNTDYRSSRF